MRPTLARLAARHGWAGRVRNTAAGLELTLEGQLPDDSVLAGILAAAIPPGGELHHCHIEPLAVVAWSDFQIEESRVAGPISAPPPQDRKLCHECLAEFQDPGNRRYHYGLIACAECGPRFSLTTAMPFDRSRTSLCDFALCAECMREYHTPEDRRFHAQTIACPICGPQVWAETDANASHTRGDAALVQAADQIRRGGVVALKGVGGYQLLADATSQDAVARVRERKQRPQKPLAILCQTILHAHTLVDLSEAEVLRMSAADNPIVLCRQRAGTGLTPAVNPGLSDLGVLLPTTALHLRLCELVERPLVCTSGNRDGEPLIVNELDPRLKELADLRIHHNRRIVAPIDDSVVRIISGRSSTIRAGRGLAPIVLPLPEAGGRPTKAVIACGGHLKSAIAVSNGGVALLGAHVGDLNTAASRQHWERQREHLFRLISPPTPNVTALNLVCDAHPDYASSRWAMTASASTRRVWHHQAHVAAAQLEHGWLDREVLGIAWDGTGLGPDGTIWGGEFLRVHGRRFQRLARVRPFRLPGGEPAIRDVRRIAVSLLSQLEGLSPPEMARLVDASIDEVLRWQRICETEHSPVTSSMGRLLDGFAVFILGARHSEYEGAVAQRLESVCLPDESGQYEFLLSPGRPRELDWRPVLLQALADRARGESAGTVAMRLHRGLASAIIAVSRMVPTLPAVVCGGCFQNRILGDCLSNLWPCEGPPLGLPGIIPCGDGGLAAGQLAIEWATT